MQQQDSSSEIFNIKAFLAQVNAHKFFYILSAIIFVSLAYLYNRYSPMIYQVGSKIGPIEENRGSILQSNEMFSGMSGLGNSGNIENDINSLSSFSLVSETLTKLNLETGYYTKKKHVLDQPVELYRNSPYFVTQDKSHNQVINTPFNIYILNENSYRLVVEANNAVIYNYLDNSVISYNNSFSLDTICKFNETISNSYFKFSISRNPERPFNRSGSDEHYFVFHQIDNLAKKYLSRLTVQPVSNNSSLINVYFKGKNINLAIDFLNTYLETYLDNNLSKKNKIALNTVNFIDSQLSEISDSLVLSESKLSDYRTSNRVTDLSYQGQRALEQLNEIENQLSTLQVQKRYYNYVLDYLNKNEDLAGLAPPSVANVSDPIMNTMVLELLDLNAQRSTILSNNADKNLFLGQIENQIRLQKKAIIENVTNTLNTLSLTENELNYRNEKVSKEIARLPRTELNMVSMQRKFNLTDAIYTFLLQRRSEAAISMASNNPDYEILEPARYINRIILSPKTTINYMISVFLALIFPSVIIILRNFFNENVSSIRDAEYMLNKPVINSIFTNYTKTEAVVPEKPASYIAESFRNLRTNLSLKLRDESHKVVMVTSSQPQDGKSFISFNLAASIASVGHKTIIIDGDLRRPTLHNKFKLKNEIGLSNFMVNHTVKEDIIIKSSVENLHFIPAGPIMPDSSEKLESGALDELINDLRKSYDYVIIDTTPTGLVADASLMIKYVSHILLVCRNNYTRKDVFADVLKTFKTNEIDNFDVVFNDLNIKKSRYGRYNAYYR